MGQVDILHTLHSIFKSKQHEHFVRVFLGFD